MWDLKESRDEPDDDIEVVNGFGSEHSNSESWWAKTTQTERRIGNPSADVTLQAVATGRSLEIHPDHDRQAPWVYMLMSLQEELRAYLFLFIEVASTGFAAASCRSLCNCIWHEDGFWKAYAGICLRSREQMLPPTSAAQWRRTFRRWLFHLDGRWAQEFASFVDEGRRSDFGADYLQLLADARYIVSGLMPEDDPSAVEEFLDLLGTMLSEYSPSQLDERSAAESLILKVESRGDVFSDVQIEKVVNAFQMSLERAALDHSLEAVEQPMLLDPLLDHGFDNWRIDGTEMPEDGEGFPPWDIAHPESPRASSLNNVDAENATELWEAIAAREDEEFFRLAEGPPEAHHRTTS